MGIESIITVGAVILSGILAPLLYIWTTLVKRLDKVESKLERKIDENEVRVLLDDRISPINRNIEEIKALLYQVILKLKDN